MATSGASATRGEPVSPANEPAVICAQGLVSEPYHYWRGASGARYLHSVYSLIECPAMPKANYILVRREKDGTRRPLRIGQTMADAHSLNLAHLRHMGARLGANEVHIHLLAESALERDMVETDLTARQLGPASARGCFAAANDGAVATVA